MKQTKEGFTMNDRDMYYGSYGYGGFTPVNGMLPSGIPTGMQPTFPNQMPYQAPQNSYATSQFNDMNERINRLERQVKRLDQRLTRIETPYANTSNTTSTNEPDSNMYMM